LDLRRLRVFHGGCAGRVLRRARDDRHPRRNEYALCDGVSCRPAGLSAACEGRSPHGFLQQEAEVAAGIARFIGGARY